MAIPAPVAGWQCKVRVNGQVFAAAEWSNEHDCQDVSVTNTEGEPGNAQGNAAGAVGGAAEGTAARVAGPQQMRMRVKAASFDPDNNPFLSPTAIEVGEYATVDLYPEGLDGVSARGLILVTKSNYSGTVDRAQPLELEGGTDGDFVNFTS